MDDIPELDLLGYAKRYLLTHMRESGMADEVIEEYISRIPFNNPLRNYFARQFMGMLSEEKALEVAARLLTHFVEPTQSLMVHTERSDFMFPISSHLNGNTVQSIIDRVFNMDSDKNTKTLKDN